MVANTWLSDVELDGLPRILDGVLDDVKSKISGPWSLLICWGMGSGGRRNLGHSGWIWSGIRGCRHSSLLLLKIALMDLLCELLVDCLKCYGYWMGWLGWSMR